MEVNRNLEYAYRELHHQQRDVQQAAHEHEYELYSHSRPAAATTAADWPLHHQDVSMNGAAQQLPPGFRFHPTEQELVGFYLRRRAAGLQLPSHVIAEVELYKHDPWELPGLSPLRCSSKDSQWFFFNLYDKKYPKGPRANRATLSGYWKATGRDRSVPAHHNPIFGRSAQSIKTKAVLPPRAGHDVAHVSSSDHSSAPPPCTSGDHVLPAAGSGIKKTLVFYHGRAPRGTRTPWVMHEFHLCNPEPRPSSSSPAASDHMQSTGLFSSRIVLCRIVKKPSQPPAARKDIDQSNYESEHDDHGDSSLHD